MRIKLILLILLFAVMSCQNSSLNYPHLEDGKTEDKYFGTTVSDPYRELENDSSTTTLGWLKAQNELTNSYFDELDNKEKIRSELSKFSDQTSYWLPQKKAGKYFYYYKDSTFKKRVYCYSEKPNDSPKVLINTMELFENENIRISGGIRVSDDGQYLAFMTSRGGEDRNVIHVFDTETRKLLADRLENVKYSDISWAEIMEPAMTVKRCLNTFQDIRHIIMLNRGWNTRPH